MVDLTRPHELFFFGSHVIHSVRNRGPGEPYIGHLVSSTYVRELVDEDVLRGGCLETTSTKTIGYARQTRVDAAEYRLFPSALTPFSSDVGSL